MSDIKRLKKALPGYLRSTKQARREERIVVYYCNLIKDVFPKIGPDGPVPFIGKPVRVSDSSGKSSTKEADLLWDDVLIEFESNLSNPKIVESERQLREYVSGCLNKDRNKAYKLFSSDGVIFRRYAYRYPTKKDTITPGDVTLEFLGELNLDKKSWKGKEIGYVGLYETIRDDLTPEKLNFVSIENVHKLFISKSELYNRCMEVLADADRKHYDVQFTEWKKYQNLVYGNFIKSQTDEAVEKQYEIFLNHTYMATIAKVLAYAAISPDRVVTMEEKEAILTGRAFSEVHIHNFITEDFFSWIVKDRPVWSRIMDLIFGELKKFEVRNIDRDILRSIYETIEEPKDRHELGAVYTPEWLAEMILNELLEQWRKSGRTGIPSILDPACGSGTFLAIAVKKIRAEYGSKDGKKLLEKILKSVVGFDLHPVAVLFSKTNYLIALKSLMEDRRDAVSIPVYMADTVDFPEPKSASEQVNTDKYGDVSIYVYPVDKDHDLVLPKDVIESRNLDMVIDAIQACAKKISRDRSRIEDYLEGLRNALAGHKVSSGYQAMIRDTAQTLACLIEQNKDTIHSFIFKNIYKPAIVDDFDIIMGNPPWVVYKNITDEKRQNRLKSFMTDYKLLSGQKNFQAMEMATLFFVRCMDRFLKKDGLIGFVMPRSILQADQHHEFRLCEQKGKMPMQYTLLYDMGDPMRVRNLFTIESCVLFGRKKNTKHSNKITSYQLSGKPKEDSNLEDVESLGKDDFTKIKENMYLHEWDNKSTITVLKELYVKKSPYITQFKQGATIVPQAFWFVERSSGSMGTSKDYPLLKTKYNPNAKAPWDDITIKGSTSKNTCFPPSAEALSYRLILSIPI